MKTKHPINLLFDLGNVLFDLDIPRATTALGALMKPEADQKVIDKVMLAYECGQLSDELFINGILSQSHRHVQALDVIMAWNSILVGMPRCRLDMLQSLKWKYNVYLLSNTNAIHLEWVHRYLKNTYDVDDFEGSYFHKAYYSHHLGVRKPSMEIFKMVTTLTPLIPEETLYLDDLQDNIDMGASLGFQTYHVGEGEEVAGYFEKW